MKRLLLPMLIFVLLLSSCSLPVSKTIPTEIPTTSGDSVQTQVSQLLTSTSPTQAAATPTLPVAIPSPIPTNTLEPTTAVPVATSAPTEMATPTAEPLSNTVTPTTAATATAAPTMVIPTSDPRKTLGDPTFKDTFGTSTNWASGEDKYTKAVFTNNTLVLTGLTTTDGWRLAWSNLADFYLEETVTTGTCSGSDRYGVMLRVPDLATANQGYVYGFTCNGQYSLRKWDGTHMTLLAGWKADKAILAGSNQTNRLGILMVGSRISLYANGVHLADVTDASYAKGGIGLFIGANTTPNFTVTISEVDYWENPK
jgi:hypothetical protein